VTLLLPLLCQVAGVSEAREQESRAALIRNALVLVDLRTDLEDMIDGLKADIDRDPASAHLSAERRQEAVLSFQRWFSPLAMEAQVVGALKANYDEVKLRGFTAAYRNPLVKRMQALDRLAGQPQQEAAKKQFLSRIKQSPTFQARVKLLERLDDATILSDTIADILFDLAGAMAALNGEESNEGPAWSDLRESMKREARNEVIQSGLFAYREISDADIESFVKLHEQPEVRWFFGQMNRALAAAFKEGFNGFLQDQGRKPALRT